MGANKCGKSAQKVSNNKINIVEWHSEPLFLYPFEGKTSKFTKNRYKLDTHSTKETKIG